MKENNIRIEEGDTNLVKGHACGIEENNNPTEDVGTLKISDEVVATIASIAAYDVAGVSSLVGGFTGGIVEFLGGKKSVSKGVKVDITGNNVSIDIHLLVTYGFKIPEVAWEIQEKVKAKVEEITGLTVSKVNIHVDGLNIEKPQKEEEESAEEISNEAGTQE
jgi:uncharacterized alkaline shock family protein YloU